VNKSFAKKDPTQKNNLFMNREYRYSFSTLNLHNLKKKHSIESQNVIEHFTTN